MDQLRLTLTGDLWQTEQTNTVYIISAFRNILERCMILFSFGTIFIVLIKMCKATFLPTSGKKQKQNKLF